MSFFIVVILWSPENVGTTYHRPPIVNVRLSNGLPVLPLSAPPHSCAIKPYQAPVWHVARELQRSCIAELTVLTEQGGGGLNVVGYELDQT